MSKCLMCNAELGGVIEGHVCWICYKFGELIKRIREETEQKLQEQAKEMCKRLEKVGGVLITERNIDKTIQELVELKIEFWEKYGMKEEA